MFARAKRFTEITGCAPPPGTYDPKDGQSKKAVFAFLKSDRFKEIKDATPCPSYNPASSFTLPTYANGSAVSTPGRSRRTRNPSSGSTSEKGSSKTSWAENQVKPKEFLHGLEEELMRAREEILGLRKLLEENKVLLGEKEGELHKLRSSIEERYIAATQPAVNSTHDRELKEASTSTESDMVWKSEELTGTETENLLQNNAGNEVQSWPLENNEILNTTNNRTDGHNDTDICHTGATEKVSEEQQIEQKLSLLSDWKGGLLMTMDCLDNLQNGLELFDQAAKTDYDQITAEFKSQLVLSNEHVSQLENEKQHLVYLRDVESNRFQEEKCKLEEKVKSAEEENVHLVDEKMTLLEKLSFLEHCQMKLQSQLTGLEQEKEVCLLEKNNLLVTVTHLQIACKELQLKFDIVLENHNKEASDLRDELETFELQSGKLFAEKEELQDLVAAVICNKEQLEKQVQELQEQKSELLKAVEEQKQIVKSLNEDITAKLQAEEVIEQSLLQSQIQVCDLENQVQEYEAENGSLLEKIASLNNEVSTISSKNKNLEQDLKEKQEQVTYLEAEVEKVRAKEEESSHQEEALKCELLKEKKQFSKMEWKFTELESESRTQLEKMKSELSVSQEQANRFEEKIKECETESKEREEKLKVDLAQSLELVKKLGDAVSTFEAKSLCSEEKLLEELLAKETLAEEISQLEETRETLMMKIFDLKFVVEEKTSEATQLHQQLQLQEEKQSNLRALQVNLEATVSKKHEVIKHLSENLQALSVETVSYKDDVEKYEARVLELEESVKGEKEKLAYVKTNLSEYRSEVNAKSNTIIEIQNKLHDTEERLKVSESNCAELNDKIRETITEMKEMQNKLNENEQNLETKEETVTVLNVCIQKQAKEIEMLRAGMETKQECIDQMNVILSTKTQDLKSLYEALEEKQTRLLNNEKCIAALEENTHILKEELQESADTILQLQEEMAGKEEEFRRYSEVAEREAQSNEVHLSSLREKHAAELNELEDKVLPLQNDCAYWRKKYEDLQNMVEPFREQLEAFEMEKNALISRNAEAQSEVQSLAIQYGKLLGHQNQKQKIQYVVKLKQENIDLKQEMSRLQEHLCKQKRTITKLEDKVNALSGARRVQPTAAFLYGNEKENLSMRENKDVSFIERDGILTPLKPRQLGLEQKRERVVIKKESVP